MSGRGDRRSPAGKARLRRARALVFGAVLVLWAALATPVRADFWYRHYENAEEALAAEDWRLAIEELNQALERKGDSGHRVRTYGMNVVDYFPYLKLGIAYYRLGQHEAALEAFATEERLGVVERSDGASGELDRFRQLVLAAQDEAERTAREGTEAVIRESLAQARSLADQGRVDDAMNALGPGLAAAPDRPELTELMAELSSRAVAEERERQIAADLAAMTERARERLAQGDPGEAASLLRQILARSPNDEARQLLAAARDQIRAQVEADRRDTEIRDALNEARDLGNAGSFDDALGRLELVFALEPTNGPAAALRQQFLADKNRERVLGEIRDTVALAEEHLAAGRHAEALSAANRALARDRTDAGALDLVRRAYAEISRRMLEAPLSENLPPAIRFTDERTDLDGVPTEVVRAASFRLGGVVIDRSPVTLTFEDQTGRSVQPEVRSQPVGELFLTEFTVRERLGAGETIFRVSAVDERGASSSSEYRVLYERPWFRAPGVRAAAVAAPVAALLLAYGLRARRRKSKLRRRFNPYLAGGPVFDENLFFGRERLVQRILQTVHNNSLLLHGERRIGKTSLLHQVRQRLEQLDDPEYAFYPAYVDLQGTSEERFFWTLAEQIREALAPVLGETSVPVPPTGDANEGHRYLVRELHRILGELRAQSPKEVKLVLLIDEVDELNHYDPRVNQKLRSLFMKRFAENLVAVVAGVHIVKEWEREASPLVQLLRGDRGARDLARRRHAADRAADPWGLPARERCGGADRREQ